MAKEITGQRADGATAVTMQIREMGIEVLIPGGHAAQRDGGLHKEFLRKTSALNFMLRGQVEETLRCVRMTEIPSAEAACRAAAAMIFSSLERKTFSKKFPEAADAISSDAASDLLLRRMASTSLACKCASKRPFSKCIGRAAIFKPALPVILPFAVMFGLCFAAWLPRNAPGWVILVVVAILSGTLGSWSFQTIRPFSACRPRRCWPRMQPMAIQRHQRFVGGRTRRAISMLFAREKFPKKLLQSIFKK